MSKNKKKKKKVKNLGAKICAFAMLILMVASTVIGLISFR